MADSTSPAIQECTTCGALLDVTDEQPLALRHCPTCGAAMRVRRTFGHFELQEILGAGGMGAVYRAHDSTLHRDVALKLLRPEHSQSQELIASFSKEAAVTASINHPHVVKVYSTGTDHGVFFIAMELVDRGSLDELMSLQGQIGEAQLLEVGIQVAQGLNAAYQRGLIHRDVKPGNILFADAHNAKIVDFGLAVLQEHANKDGGPIWGTPYYVAPEKLEDPPRENFRSDMYSLGATLFHAAAGRPPFDAETVSMVQLKHLKSQLVSIQSFAPEISTTTAHVINKMLHRFPERRYASYDELIENLQYAREELLRAAGDAPAPKPESTAWLSIGMAAAVVVGGVAAYEYRDRLFHPAAAIVAATPAPTPAAAPSVQSLYDRALGLLAAGKFSAAATALRALDARPGTPQPLQNWITLHAALASLFAGQADEARQDLAKVEERGEYSADPAEQALGKFFLATARLAAAETPTPASAAAAFDATNHEAFALLLLGVKDWTLGAFDDASTLLTQFQNALPGPATWLRTLQPLAANLTADLAAIRSLSATPPTEIAALEKALEGAKELRAKQKIEGKFTVRLGELSATLEQQLTAAREAKAAKESAMDAADGKLVAEALRGIGPAYAAFRFTDAQKVLAGVHCESDARKAEVEGWVKRTEWLAQFKSTLIRDLNTIGYAAPLTRRSGTPLPNLGHASDANAEMKTPYGLVPVPWSDLTIESFAALAQTFARSAPAAESADRTWRLGVFLYAFGKKPEGLAALRQAATAKPEYQPFLESFPEN